MNDAVSSAVVVDPAPRRWAPWWVAASALFTIAALADMLRSMPASVDGASLHGLNVTASLGLGLAFLASAVAAGRRNGFIRLSRGVVVALVVFSAWVLLDPVRSLLDSVAPDAAFFLDALVRLALSGVIATAVLRSPLEAPWRAIPAVALAAVVIASLVRLFVLSGALDDQSVISGILSVTNLAPLLATAALAAVAFRLARTRPESVAVLGAAR